MKKLILILIFGCATAALFAQTDTLLAPAALRSDLVLLRDTLQDVHPGLYRYRSKAYIDAVFDSCLGSIRDSMRVTSFFRLTSRVIAAMEDGHTNCRLPGPLMKAYYANADVFPAVVLFIGGRAYFLCCRQQPELATAELLTINGRPMSTIIERLFEYIPSDGAIESRKNWELDEFFPLFYNLEYGVRDSFTVGYRMPDGAKGASVLKAGLLKDVLCHAPFPRPSRYLTLEYKPGNVAVLTIRTFLDAFLRQTGEHFGPFLDSAFGDLAVKKVKRLVIDIRGNQGGNDMNGVLLYSYLAQGPFRYYSSFRSVKEEYTERQNPGLAMQRPRERAYRGKVYFLINGRSFSATAEFAAVARSNRRGVFIGEEIGGGYYGDASGDDDMVILPNSHISCRIPLMLYTMAVRPDRYPDRGVRPDYTVLPTVRDLEGLGDRQMDFALKLIASGR
ncbi:MAG TPA: S41 family peptidase [Puia sp.]|nr:S41 family peptidase [Puia sp.]